MAHPSIEFASTVVTSHECTVGPADAAAEVLIPVASPPEPQRRDSDAVKAPVCAACWAY
jgi:hypothetical protein